MEKKFDVYFPKIDSDIFEIEMMELEGIPLFFHSVVNLQNAYKDCKIFVENKSQKVIDYCSLKGIEVINRNQILPTDTKVNAYQAFYYRKSYYKMIDLYRDLQVKDLQSYLFALYIVDCLKNYSLSENQKQVKIANIINKPLADEQICLLGDSLIENWDIKSICGHKVINVGIGDLTTDECLEWIVTNYDFTKFDAVILMIGTNDLKYRYSIKHIVNNIEIIIDKIRKESTKIRIIILFIPNVYRRWDRRNDHINSLNAEINNKLCNKVELISLNELNNDYGELSNEYTTDGLHFNERAYSLLNKILINHFSILNI